MKAPRQCKNPTCTATVHTNPAAFGAGVTVKAYCSSRCQTTMRNSGQPGRGQLPDIWVGMDTERALVQRCETLGITVRDLIVNLLEAEAAPLIGWDRLDFGGAA